MKNSATPHLALLFLLPLTLLLSYTYGPHGELFLSFFLREMSMSSEYGILFDCAAASADTVSFFFWEPSWSWYSMSLNPQEEEAVRELLREREERTSREKELLEKGEHYEQLSHGFVTGLALSLYLIKIGVFLYQIFNGKL